MVDLLYSYHPLLMHCTSNVILMKAEGMGSAADMREHIHAGSGLFQAISQA